MKKYRHVLAWCLILALLICMNCNPLLISATATTAYVDIALNYENIASIAPELVPFALLLLAVKGASAFFNNIDELIDAAQDLSNRCSAVTRKWAVAVAEKIEEGISKFSVSDPYVQDINSQLEESESISSGMSLVIPDSLLGLGYLSSDEILVSSNVSSGTTTGTTTGTVDVSTSILTGIQDQLIDLSDAISSLSSTFVNKITHLQTTVSTIRVNLVEDLGEISTRINGMTQSVVSKLQTISNVLDSSINDLKTVMQTTRQNLLDGIDSLRSATLGLTQSVVSKLDSVSNVLDSSINDLKTVSQTMRTNLVDSFASLIDSVADGIKILRDRVAVGVESISTSVVSLVDSFASFPETFRSIYNEFTDALGAFLTETIALPLENVSTKVESIATAITGYFSPDPNEEGKNQVVGGGINSGIGYFGHSNGILSKYGAGFLAATSIFNLFADIPIFSDLLVISISIGLVGAFLGMVLNVSRSDAAGRKQKVGAD